MTRRASRLDVMQARSDRQIIGPFVAQIGSWQSRLARLDASFAYSERRGADPSMVLSEMRALRAEVQAGLQAYDHAICGRAASTSLAATREAFVRMLELIDATIGE